MNTPPSRHVCASNLLGDHLVDSGQRNTLVDEFSLQNFDLQNENLAILV
jgi:hypothetical protein